jgi:hypothetical protein
LSVDGPIESKKRMALLILIFIVVVAVVVYLPEQATQVLLVAAWGLALLGALWWVPGLAWRLFTQ